MAVSYSKLWHLLLDKKMTKTELCKKAGITTNACSNLTHDKSVKVETLVKICAALDCKIEDIMEIIPDEEA